MLTNYSDFEIIDYFEDCVASLQMMDNYDRWLRSSLVKGKFKEVGVVSEHISTL